MSRATAVRYIVQRYARYAIYEPAEGGYYYDEREPDDYPGELIIRDTLPEAVIALREIVQDNNKELSHEDEGLLIFWEDEKAAGAYSVNHRYIGGEFEFFVEPINRRGRKRKGCVPYC